jgi:integrase
MQENTPMSTQNGSQSFNGPRPEPGVRANQALVTRQTALVKAGFIVPYLTPEEVNQMVAAASASRHGERDGLLIRLLFETGLRISEALSVTLAHLQQFEGQPALAIIGKGRKPRLVACPRSLADSLQAYAYRHNLTVNDPVFPINRKRSHQIITKAGEKAGLQKKVYPHLLRHSDAIERLRQTGNPKALQIHLGHASPFMTMRYLSTLTAEDALRIQQQVEFPR